MKEDFGYTLLEVVVAVAIIALMAIPISSGLSMAFDVTSKTKVRVEHVEAVNQVVDRMETWLKASYPYDIYRNTETIYPLVGSEKEIAFVAPISPDPADSGLYRVYLRSDNAGRELILAFVEDNLNSNVTDEVGSQVILSDVHSLKFEYLDGSVQPAVWLDEWLLKQFLPSAIRLSLTIDEPVERTVVRTIPLVVGYRAYCVLDEVSGECRAGEVPS